MPKFTQLANGRAGIVMHSFMHACTHSFIQQIFEQPLKCQALGWKLNIKANTREGPILQELCAGEVTLLNLLCLNRAGGYWSEMRLPSYPCRCLGTSDTRGGACDTVRGSEKGNHIEDLLLPTTTILPARSALSRGESTDHRCYQLKLKYVNRKLQVPQSH